FTRRAKKGTEGTWCITARSDRQKRGRFDFTAGMASIALTLGEKRSRAYLSVLLVATISIRFAMYPKYPQADDIPYSTTRRHRHTCNHRAKCGIGGRMILW